MTADCPGQRAVETAQSLCRSRWDWQLHRDHTPPCSGPRNSPETGPGSEDGGGGGRGVAGRTRPSPTETLGKSRGPLQHLGPLPTETSSTGSREAEQVGKLCGQHWLGKTGGSRVRRGVQGSGREMCRGIGSDGGESHLQGDLMIKVSYVICQASEKWKIWCLSFKR